MAKMKHMGITHLLEVHVLDKFHGHFGAFDFFSLFNTLHPSFTKKYTYLVNWKYALKWF